MAVPQIVTVKPAQVETLGNSLIELLGFNFRPPDPPAPNIIPVPTPGPTVRVDIGSTEAINVDVATEGRLIVLIPPLNEGTYDVTVTNLDNNGDDIGGETHTLTGGLRYLYPDLTQETELTNLVRQLVLEFRKQVHPNVYTTVHTDYDEAPFSLQFVAKLPAIVLSGPELIRNQIGDTPGLVDEDIGENPDEIEFNERRQARTVDVGFEVIAISNSNVELLNLQYRLEEFIHRNEIWAFKDLDGNTCELDFEFQPGGDFQADSETNNSNIQRIRGSVVVREFSVPGSLVRRGTTVFDEVVVESLAFVGENLTNPITGEVIGPLTAPEGQGAPIRSPGQSGDG